MYQIVTVPNGFPCTDAFAARARAESYARWMFRPGSVAIVRTVDGDNAADIEHDTDERAVVDQARAIARANDDGAASAEHLRVLLRWLDGAPADGHQLLGSELDGDKPF